MINLDHNEESINIDEACEIQHINYIKEFEEKVWPIYAGHHLTKGEVLIYWKLNVLNNSIMELVEALRS